MMDRDPDIVPLVQDLYDLRRRKKELDTAEKTLLSILRPIVDPELDGLEKAGAKPVIATDSFLLRRISGTSRSISRDMLLERGVAPDIIAYATSTTGYVQYRVSEKGEGD